MDGEGGHIYRIERWTVETDFLHQSRLVEHKIVADAKSYLPPHVKLVTLRGVRIATPVAQVYKFAPLGALMSKVERALADRPVTRRLGGFLILVAQKD